ncbi:nucleoside deaminase [Natronosporangium hydrolyticum]|uniref:Nucleoside deaminase n=1 Tax=Natronosporangium hydrolyticum TaxID=2811111 RepID=A0A895YDY4_9ACTN|nr:nucleoside deaminase [Natronosporangium hydrolyticum]QSB13653.1 nucleoside deaminase [Natronosporangium hydrolyticum]
MPISVADPRHAHWLAEAVSDAVANVAAGGGPFAALVVQGEQVLGRGVNRVTADNDPTAHAEVVAIRDACRRLGDFRLDGCVLVSSCEPCPMCLGAALWAHLDRIVYAADRHDAAASGFDDRAFYRLFDTPREQWPVPVERVVVGDATAPFHAWRADPSRIDY